MVFRLYSEVLWYPGRQLNIMNMLQGSSIGASAAAAHSSSEAAPTTPTGSTSSTSSAASSTGTSGNRFSSIFTGLKKDKEEAKVVDYK